MAALCYSFFAKQGVSHEFCDNYHDLTSWKLAKYTFLINKLQYWLIMALLKTLFCQNYPHLSGSEPILPMKMDFYPRSPVKLMLLAGLMAILPVQTAFGDENSANYSAAPRSAAKIQVIPAATVQIVSVARARTLLDVRYDPKYVRLAYPNGDVAADTGVCTDVVIRSFRTAYRHDLQKSVHEDMKSNFAAYPKMWGLSGPDKNIDHRRVPNLEAFFKRQGAALPITQKSKDYKAGDIVSWRLGGRVAHIGIVSDKKSAWGTPLVIHNIGAGVVEDDLLFDAPINGHFRYTPKANQSQ